MVVVMAALSVVVGVVVGVVVVVGVFVGLVGGTVGVEVVSHPGGTAPAVGDVVVLAESVV